MMTGHLRSAKQSPLAAAAKLALVQLNRMRGARCAGYELKSGV
ncbi:MAG: hypothetical protein ACXQTR_06100 [Candidatus Methanospirareceae archaeon]